MHGWTITFLMCRVQSKVLVESKSKKIKQRDPAEDSPKKNKNQKERRCIVGALPCWCEVSPRSVKRAKANMSKMASNKQSMKACSEIQHRISPSKKNQAKQKVKEFRIQPEHESCKKHAQRSGSKSFQETDKEVQHKISQRRKKQEGKKCTVEILTCWYAGLKQKWLERAKQKCQTCLRIMNHMKVARNRQKGPAQDLPKEERNRKGRAALSKYWPADMHDWSKKWLEEAQQKSQRWPWTTWKVQETYKGVQHKIYQRRKKQEGKRMHCRNIDLLICKIEAKVIGKSTAKCQRWPRTLHHLKVARNLQKGPAQDLPKEERERERETEREELHCRNIDLLASRIEAKVLGRSKAKCQRWQESYIASQLQETCIGRARDFFQEGSVDLLVWRQESKQSKINFGKKSTKHEKYKKQVPPQEQDLVKGAERRGDHCQSSVLEEITAKCQVWQERCKTWKFQLLLGKGHKKKEQVQLA